jgi:glycosyltransferase involved in cell wall biosynthesis
LNKLGVIQIIDSLNVGGAEVLAINIANGLSEQKIESHLCATREEGVLKENLHIDVGYIFLNKKNIIDFKAIIKIHKYVRKHRISIIHAHSTSSFIAVCVKIINPKIKIVWHDHFGESEFLKNRSVYSLKILSYFFSVIISVNNDLKNWAIKNLKKENVFFIRNFPVFNNQEKVTILKGTDEKRIVNLAGYRPQKDHLNLLNAFLKISKGNDDWTLHLVGKSYGNKYSDAIRKFIESKNLSKRVFQYGVCSDIQHILSQATIGVLSSKSEGLPISLLEYGLANLPAVVTNVGECSLIIKNPNFIIPPSNSIILAEALQLLINSKEKRKDLASEINKIVTSSFSKEETIFKLIEIYTKKC